MNIIRFVGEHPRTYDVRWHEHEYWELVYCTGGEGVFRFKDGEDIRYRMGQTVAIPPGAVHMNFSEGGFTNIHLTMEEPSFPQKTAFVVNDDPSGHIGIAFAQAKFYYLSDLKRQELIMAALGELITSYMIVFHDNRELSPAVEKLRSLILNRYADPGFDLAEEIHQMPFSDNYLRKLFQKEMGMTPLHYQTELRMKKAKASLTTAWNQNCSMVELAESCGFRDALYFSRVFKEYFKCSPTKFAKLREAEAKPEGPAD